MADELVLSPEAEADIDEGYACTRAVARG